ncbi:MAG: tryptophan 7-halogenase, partial [Psychrosphaera sp.]|nr:tryptophan 7-halogenase [Psychrosphaera sp.]
MTQHTQQKIKKVVIVGGGSAGWLTAGLLAARHLQGKSTNQGQLEQIILLESPDINPIGVGEGTWPTMRSTLLKIGISETDLIRQCHATFKQGSMFTDWTGTSLPKNQQNDHYCHPFSLPQQYAQLNLVPHWQAALNMGSAEQPFADAVSPQSYLCQQGLGPKQHTMPEYAFVANYGYHLDAAKFAQLLKTHCVEKLGVTHLLDHVTHVNGDLECDIESLTTKNNGNITADLFIDCSGLTSLLIGKHYQMPFIDAKQTLFNDSALVVQVPYDQEDAPIASHTRSTAQSAGWIWDIGLSSRRGIGYVYSSAHQNDDKAEQTLLNYLSQSIGDKAASLSIRKIPINPGYRKTFWHHNCVAVGLSAGFLEPLEASALVMIELAANQISEQLPANRQVMDILAKRFNDKFEYRWQRIIDFLKLHYVLSQRTDSDYWHDNRQSSTVPDSLQALLSLWRYQSP